MRRTSFVGLLAIFGSLWAAGMHAQVLPSGLPPETPAQKLANVSFEVVSVKENPRTLREQVEQVGPPQTSMLASGLFVARGELVFRLIMSAYGVRNYQIVGGPNWIFSTLFDIDAKAPEGFEMGQTKAMMRSMLADRFSLLIQKETRMLPTYSLEWAERRHRLGPGIRPSPPQCGDSTQRAGAGGQECSSGTGWMEGGIFIRRAPVSSLVLLLTNSVGRPVFDKTGLAGLYDADVKASGLVPGSSQLVNPDLGDGASIFTAVREQLNLKLVPTKDKVEVLVIRRVERPTSN